MLCAKECITFGDWEDEYCDLTLDKLVSQTNKSVVKELSIPNDKEELIEQLSKLQESGKKSNNFIYVDKKPNKIGMVNKIKLFFKGDKR